MYNKIQKILINNFYWIKEKDIKLDSNLRYDLKLDSLSIINLQVTIEDEFGIRFNPLETDLSEVFNTISSLIKYIEKNS